ncbi:mitochondrial enolase superfamily member 1 [Grus japonensis]|uniref:Mitochondrial enolase superfamily member 1 n=1 Tax=Grus japonensis TaxID=30415 RepID=A0ABC9W3X0_GRUJA
MKLTDWLEWLEFLCAALQKRGRVVDIVYLDFGEAFNAISHKILIDKLLMYGFDEQIARWMENWLNGWAQRMVIGGMKSSWRVVTRSVPQGATLGPVLLSIFINDLDDGAECILSKFAHDVKLGGVADIPEDGAAIQRDIDTLEIWADRNLMKCHKEQFEVLHLGRNNPRHQYMPVVTQLESSFAEKDLRVLVDNKMTMS